MLYSLTKHRVNHHFVWIVCTTILLLYSCQNNRDRLIENPCSLAPEFIEELLLIDSVVNTDEFVERDQTINQVNYGINSLLTTKNNAYRLKFNSPWYEIGTEIYTIRKNRKGCFVHIKKYHDHADTIGNELEFEVPKEVWRNIDRTMENNQFWVSSSHDSRGYLDPTSWTIEGYRSESNPCTFQSYHRVSRLNLRDSIFKNMCNSLFGLDPNRKESP